VKIGVWKDLTLNYVWVKHDGCNDVLSALLTRTNFSIIERRKAIYRKNGNITRDTTDWNIMGSNGGGMSANMLWLYGRNKNSFTFMEAYTQFTQYSSAVAFVMDGDYNDGFAEFLVDGKTVGTFDLYNLRQRETVLLVCGLQINKHELRVKSTDKKNPNSNGFDVHICGGLALI
jgi:hypothetical protein